MRKGFTILCLQHLQTQKLSSDGGSVRGVGGLTLVDLAPEGPLVQGCLQRMVAWSQVVLEVAATEFPDWELLGAFAVFRLEEPPARATPVPLPPPTPIGRAAQNCLRQLAKVFHVDFSQLREEFQNHQRPAQGHRYMYLAT